ncbi:MAG: hypothetical protein AAGA17_19400, partial [Actinomycetota bacterium]
MPRSLMRLLALLLAFGLVAAACGDSDDEETSDTTEASASASASEPAETTEAPAEEADTTEAPAEEEADTTEAPAEEMSGSLSELCPPNIVIQKDWNPESEHGMLYELIGKEGYEINAGAAIVSGDLVFQGEDTGVDIEIRSGGPAIGFQQVTAQ